MIINGDDVDSISDFKASLYRTFEMKDLGSLSYFLGLEVISTDDGIYLSQAKYASDLLAGAGIIDSRTESTPLESNVQFTPMDGTVLDNPILYRQLVRGLIYLTITRPDIAYLIRVLSQFLLTPMLIKLVIPLIVVLLLVTICFLPTLSFLGVLRSKRSLLALADTTAEVISVRWLLEDLSVPQSSPTDVFCDNRSAIQINTGSNC
ncbi:uncharacterized mitochondrial protein AtMg00810-like [Arachis duranensis]|uniref:Uncharacterized mitochondrial protein AtMg00810-like n=1 Tax=Arachis duranensis TaxID=130453 RepID=A0A6P4C7Y9_ARADU|nr:uncharacterized mitochondrial protein AtMg00810-like [Arachis duranensis]